MPRSDTFDENSASPATSAVSAFFSGYIRAIPAATGSYSGTVSGETYTFTCVAGSLLNAYSLEGGLPFNVANFAWSSPGATEFVASSRRHFFTAVWRQAWVENAKATANFFNHVVSGGLNPKSFKNSGVGVRIQGGTATGTGQAEVIQNHTGYWLIACNTAATGANPAFLLLRCNAGTWSTLASQTVDSLFPGANPFFNSSKSYALSLQAVTSGSTVVLTAKIINAVDPVTGEAITNETTLFGGNVVDSSGSRVTGAGRYGFGMSGYDDEGNNPPSGYATSRSTHLCRYFEAYDVDAADVVLRDEFERPQNYGTGSTSASTTAWRDPNGVRGVYIGSTWAQDAYGAGGTSTGTGSGSLQNLRVNIGSNRLTTSAGGFTTHGSTYFLVPSFSPYYSDRQVDFLSATFPGQDSLGLHGRGSQFAGTNSRYMGGGYAFVVRNLSLGAALCAIYAINKDSAASSTLIAQYSGTLAEFSMSAGVAFTMRLKLDNIGADPANGQVRIQGWINGVAVAFNTNNPTGVTFDGTSVIDNRSNRSTWGWYEGIWVEDWENLRIDNWTDLTSATPPEPDDETILEEDMASIAFNSECYGKTGTLSIPFDWGVRETTQSVTVLHDTEAGYVTRMVRHLKHRRTWQIAAKAITDSERTTLLDFWTAHKGVEIPFDWVEPELGSTVPVRFKNDALAIALANPAVRQFAFELEEVFC